MRKFCGRGGCFVIKESFQRLQAAPGVESSLLWCCCLASLEHKAYLLAGLEFIMQKE